MTAVALAQCEHVPCITCGGSGELGTGEREYETGVYITTNCHACGGDGHVDARWVLVCRGCGEAFWAGTGCEHHGINCEACMPANCTDCRDEARHV